MEFKMMQLLHQDTGLPINCWILINESECIKFNQHECRRTETRIADKQMYHMIATWFNWNLAVVCLIRFVLLCVRF